jgi:hypothetical protein
MEIYIYADERGTFLAQNHDSIPNHYIRSSLIFILQYAYSVSLTLYNHPPAIIFIYFS